MISPFEMDIDRLPSPGPTPRNSWSPARGRWDAPVSLALDVLALMSAKPPAPAKTEEAAAEMVWQNLDLCFPEVEPAGR